MKRILVLWVVCLMVDGLISRGDAVVDRVVAVVNQEVITLSEVEKLIGPLRAQIETRDRLEKHRALQEASRKALDLIIEERLVDQEARRSGVKVSTKDVEETIEEVKKRNNATQEQLEAVLKREGMTFEAYKKDMERNLQRLKLVQSNVKLNLKVSEKELEEFYRANIGRYQSNLTYRPGHILFLIPKDANPEGIREIRKKGERVLEKIRAGGDFGEMALLYSQDLSSKDRGDLGYFKKGELLPAFEKEALRLRVGEVGGIVRTEHGFHIIKLLDRKGGEPKSFEEVKQQVEADHRAMAMEKAYREFISTLKAKAVIEIKL